MLLPDNGAANAAAATKRGGGRRAEKGVGDIYVEQTTHEKQAKSEPVQLLLWLACRRHDSKTPTANLCVCVCVFKGMLGSVCGVVCGVMMRCQNHVRRLLRVGAGGHTES